MLSSEGQKDPVNFLWNLWRKHNQHGMLYLKMLKLNLMFVGDYETIKYIYNHQDVQVNKNIIIRVGNLFRAMQAKDNKLLDLQTYFCVSISHVEISCNEL